MQSDWKLEKFVGYQTKVSYFSSGDILRNERDLGGAIGPWTNLPHVGLEGIPGIYRWRKFSTEEF